MKLEKPACGLAPVALKMVRTAQIPSTTRKIKPMKFCRRRKRFRAALRRLRTNGDCPSGRAAGASVGAPPALVRANRSRPSQRGRAMGYTSNPRTQVAQRETRRPSPILRGRDRQSNREVPAGPWPEAGRGADSGSQRPEESVVVVVVVVL